MTVAPGFKDVSDAAGGPLGLGLYGVVITDDKSGKPYKVRTAHCTAHRIDQTSLVPGTPQPSTF